MILRSIIIGSTILGLFSASAYFTAGGVHFLIFYPLMIVNLSLLWLERSLWVPPGLLLLFTVMVASATFGIVHGTDTLPLFLKSFSGVALSGVYFCAFIRYMRFDVERCFALYARAAFYVAVLGIVFYARNAALGLAENRLQSIFAEPAGFPIVCLPALFYFGDRWHRLREQGWHFVIMLFAMIFTGSSVAFLGMLFGLYLFGTRFRFGGVFMPCVIALAGVGIYGASSDFRLRMDDSLTGLVTQNASTLNLSSFALFSNAFITQQVLKQHLLIGNGIGSHPLSSAVYVGQLPGVQTFLDQGMERLENVDAGSLLLRLLSETGLFGTLSAFGFVWYCFPKTPAPDRKGIAMAVLTYMFVKLLRSGIYFDPEVFFFLTIYAVNGSPVFRRARNLLDMEQAVRNVGVHLQV